MRLIYEWVVALLNWYIRFWRARDLTWKGQAMGWARIAHDNSQMAHDDRQRWEIADLLLALAKHDALTSEQKRTLTLAFRAVSRRERPVPSTVERLAHEMRSGESSRRLQVTTDGKGTVVLEVPQGTAMVILEPEEARQVATVLGLKAHRAEQEQKVEGE